MASSFLEKKAKKQAEELEKKYGSSAYGGTTWLDEQLNPSKKSSKTDDDIAPVSTIKKYTETKEYEEKPWYEKGLFADGYDFGDVSKTILGLDKENASLLDLTWNSAERGFYNARYGEETYKAMTGQKNQKEAVEAILADDKYDFAPGSTVGKAVSGAFELLGQQARQWTHPRSLAAATGAAGAVALAGQAGPLVLAPEEIITVPGAFIAGMTAGSAGTNYEIEAGHAYNEMLEAGISEETAKKVAVGVGGINAALELVQLDELTDAYKVLSKTGTADTAIKRIAKELLDRGVDIAKETAQEVAQEGVTITGTQMASKLDKGEWAYNADEVTERLGDTAISSALSFGMLNAPAAVKNTVAIAKDQKATTSLTDTEKAVVKKEVENRIAESEKDGNKLTTKEKNKLYDSVVKDMERGYISTDTIEEVLGGESYNTFKSEMDGFFDGETFKSYKEALVSEDAEIKKLESQLKELENEPNTVGNSKKFDAIQSQIDELKNNPKSKGLKSILDQEAVRINGIKNQLRDEVSGLVKDSRLAESYRELARKNEKFTVDLNQYKNENAKKTMQNLMDSGLGDNSRQFHEFADFLARLSADKGTTFTMTNDEQLAKTEYWQEGAKVNAFINENGDIVLNKSSERALNTSVGHEITHVLESSKELYGELSEVIKNYAISKEGLDGYNKRIQTAERLYKNRENTTAEKEVVADLVGEYLFTDSDFIHRLSTENRNVFQKIYDEIKYLYKVATAGSKEARELEKVKKAFEDAYRANGKAEGGTKYSFSGVNPNEGGYQIPHAEQMEAEGKTSEEIRQETGWFRSYDNRWRYEIDDSKAVWHLDTAKPDQKHLFRFGERQYKLEDLLEHEELYKAYPQLKDVVVYVNPNTEFGGYVVGRNTDHIAIHDVADNYSTKCTLIHELQHIIQNIEGFAPGASKYEYSYLDWGDKEYEALEKRNEIAKKLYAILRRNGESISREAIAYNQNSYNVSDEIIEDSYWKLQTLGWRNKRTQDLVDAYYEQVQILNRTTPEGQYHATAGEIEAYDAQARMNMSAEERKAMRPNVDRADAIVKDVAKYSLSDSEGKQLTKEQQEYFKDSKVRDEDGNLKVMYHGTSRGGFTVFDTYKSKYGLFGTGFYFTDSENIGESYTKKGKGNNPQVYEAYLNIKNPLDMDAQADPAEWSSAFDEVDFPESGTNEEFYRALEEYYTDQYISKWEVEDIIRESIEYGMGYDGITHIGGGRVNPDGERHRVYIAFEPEQIKSTANAKPTGDADIRYSLSDGKSEVVDGIAVATNVAEIMKSSEYSKPKDYMTRYSVSTTPAWAENYLAQNKTEEAEAVVKAVKDFTDKMVQNDAIRGYVPMGEYKTTKMGPLRTNVEYIWTFDMDTSCPRTFQFLNFRDAIQRKAGRYLTYNESINLLELMRAYGQQIPCCYCYVENKRVLLSASYVNFFGFRNNVMNAATNEDAAKVMYGYSEKKGLPDASRKALDRWRSDLSYNPSLTEVWTATNTARNSVLNFLDGEMASGNIDAKTAESKLNRMVLDHFGIEDKGAVVEIEGFVKDWAYDTLANIPHTYNTDNNTDVSVVDERALALNHEALAYSKSASSAKSVENYIPYTDQLKNVSEEDRKYIMGMGGIRKHSSNDFRMDYVQDYILFYADLAAGKWTGHTYTKSADFAKIFACTGDRINMSIAFYEDADGTLRPNTDEGAFWKDVQDLRKAYKNVGSMAMVTSDNQLSYALNSDWIDMIIPFHASGLDKSVWYNLRMWNDYTSKQGERFYNADTMKQKLKDSGVEIPKGANAATVKALFEETFQPKKIYGKNGEVLKPHFFPGDTYVNGQLVPGHHNNAETYFKLCEEYGVHPRFYGIKVNDTNGNQIDVTEHPSYLKLIKETSRTDSEQEVIQFNFGNYDDYLKMTPFEYAMQRLQEEAKNGGFENTKADPYGVVKEFTEEYLDKDRPLGYLTERARETREMLLEMSRESAKQQEKILEESRQSLSEIGEQPRRYGDYNIFGKDIGVNDPLAEFTQGTVSKTENVADVAKNATTTAMFPDDLSPMSEDESSTGERLASLEDAPPEAEAPYYGEEAPVAPGDPFADRDYKDVGKKNVKAYMYEHPEVKPFFQMQAKAMLGDLQNSVKGKRWYNDDVYYATNGEDGWGGTERQTTDDIAYLLDKGYTYAQIEYGLKAIIEDNGAENIAIAKRIEFALNDRLRKGYTDINGFEIPANQDYINTMARLETAEAVESQIAPHTDADAPVEDIAPTKVPTAVNPYDAMGAAPYGFDPITQLQYKYGNLPDGEHPVREDSMPKSITGKDKVSLTARTVKGAGATPDEFVDLLHKETLGGRFSYIPIKNSDTVQKAYDEIVKKGWEAARGEWAAKVRRGKVSAELTATGSLLLNHAAKAGDRNAWLDVLHDYQIMGTNAGQAVQAMRILKTLTPDDSLYMIERSVEQMVEDMKLGTEIVIDDNLKQNYLNAKTDSERDAARKALAENIAKQIPSTAMDKWTALRYLNMLGNFRTQVRNVIGNFGMSVTTGVRNSVATSIEWIANKASGGKFHRTKSIFVNKGQLKAARNDFENVKTVALNGGKFNDPMAKSLQFQQEVQDARKIFKIAPLEWYRRGTNRAMDTGDLVFSKAAYGRALAGYLKANGIKETDFSKIDQQTLDEARAYAINEAQETTFRDNNWLSSWVSKLGRGKNTPKGVKIVSEGVMPFRKTPANILLRAEEYSPLGIVNATVKSIQAAKGTKNVTGADVVNSWAKALTGTGLFALGMWLNNSGMLSGGPDEDDDKEWFEDQYGWQNYAIQIGDHNFTIDFLSPAAMPLLMGAQLNELRQNSGIELKDLEKALLSIADPMIEMSMLQGVSDTLDNIRYAESNMGQFLVNACVSYLTQGLTNSFLGQLERSLEGQRMSTYTDKDSDLPAWLQKALGKASAKTPGWDYQQIPYVDAWGETEDIAPLPGLAENTLSPSYISQGITDAVYEELNRLNDAQSDINVYPQTPDKTVTFDDAYGNRHEDYNLSAEEYVELAQLQGQTQKELVEDILSNYQYSGLNDQEKARAVQLAYQYAKEYSRQEVLGADGFSADWMKRADAKRDIVNAIIAHTNDEKTFAYENPEKYQFFTENGISWDDYDSADAKKKQEYSDMYSWVSDEEHPGRYSMAKAVSDDFQTFWQYRSDCNNFDAKDENGETVNGLKKERVIDYINSLDIDYGARLILFRSMYDGKKDKEEYDQDIVDYLNSRDDISYDDMEAILKELG